MGNFKFNFLSRGRLESWSLDKFFLAVFKMLPCHEFFLQLYFCLYRSDVQRKPSWGSFHYDPKTLQALNWYLKLILFYCVIIFMLTLFLGKAPLINISFDGQLFFWAFTSASHCCILSLNSTCFCTISSVRGLRLNGSFWSLQRERIKDLKNTTRFETRDARRETRDARREARGARREARDARRETRWWSD